MPTRERLILPTSVAGVSTDIVSHMELVPPAGSMIGVSVAPPKVSRCSTISRIPDPLDLGRLRVALDVGRDPPEGFPDVDSVRLEGDGSLQERQPLSGNV